MNIFFSCRGCSKKSLMIGAKEWKTRNSLPCDQSSFLSKHLDPMIHQLDEGNAKLGAEAKQRNILFGVKLIVYIQRGKEKEWDLDRSR